MKVETAVEVLKKAGEDIIDGDIYKRQAAPEVYNALQLAISVLGRLNDGTIYHKGFDWVAYPYDCFKVVTGGSRCIKAEEIRKDLATSIVSGLTKEDV